MFGLLLLLIVIYTPVVAKQDHAPEYQAHIQMRYPSHVFKAFMGQKTTPYDVSSLEKIQKWWKEECKDIHSKILPPAGALRIMISTQQGWITHKFPCWPKLTNILEYNKLPNLSSDEPNAKIWRQVISFMMVMGLLNSLANMPGAPKKFTAEYIRELFNTPDDFPLYDFQQQARLLNSFPERFQDDNIDDMLFITNQTVRHSKLRLVTMFCQKLMFSIPTFIAGLHEGLLIYPVTNHFKNSHRWGAHDNNFFGMPNLLWHDYFSHGHALMAVEQLGQALFDQPDDKPFLQSWTQYAIKQMFQSIATPHNGLALVGRHTSAQQCVHLSTAWMAILYNGLHETPINIISPGYKEKPALSADPYFLKMTRKILNTLDILAFPSNEIGAYGLMPIDQSLRRDTRALTQQCLKEWINVEANACTLEQMIELLQVIRHKVISQHPQMSYCQEYSKNLPTLVFLSQFTISCALFDGITAMLVNDSHHDITLLVPNPASLTNLTAHNARIALHALNHVALEVERRSHIISLTPGALSKTVEEIFFQNVLENARCQEWYEHYLIYPDGAQSLITRDIWLSIMPFSVKTPLSASAIFRNFTHLSCLNNKFIVQSPHDTFEELWDDFKESIAQYPAFPQLTQKASFNPPPCLQGSIQCDWYQLLSLISVMNTLSNYAAINPLTKERLERMEQDWKDRPDQLHKLNFLKNFPQKEVGGHMAKALAIIEQLTHEVGFNLRVAREHFPIVPQATFLSAIHDGTVLIPIPTHLVDIHQWSSHNSQYRGMEDLLIQREIIGYLGGILESEIAAQKQYPHDPKPFLQHWIKKRVAELPSQRTELHAMGEHLGEEKSKTHALLAQILRLYQETHEGSLLLPKAAGIPSILDNDDNFMLVCKSIFGPILGPQYSEPEQVRFIKDYLTRPHLAKINSLS